MSIFIIPCTATLFALMVVNNWYIVMVSDRYTIGYKFGETVINTFYADGDLDQNMKTSSIICHGIYSIDYYITSFPTIIIIVM